MTASKSIYTIEDLERQYYGGLFGGDRLAKDAPFAIGTTGARNIIYGSRLWSQVITAFNTFGVLAKKPWDTSGYRVISAAASTSSAGQTLGAAIPATIKPTIATVDINPKLLAVSFDMNAEVIELDGKDDMVRWADIVDYMGNEFKNRINRGLNTDVDTLAGTNIESIDRIISSYAEVANCGITAGDSDPWTQAVSGIDRDAQATAFDAYVDHNSNTDRYFALSNVDTVLQNIRPYWDDPGSVGNKTITTGYDTELRIAQLLQAQIRYTTTTVQMTVEGIKTAKGLEAGADVATYDGIPIIRDANAVQDTISRFNIIDGDHVWIGVLKPVQYTESEDYQAIDKFAREGVYYSYMELIANKFACHGKGRDYK